MKNPLITVLLCTVREEAQGYIDHPEWGTLQKVSDDLAAQTFQDFELIVVDGVANRPKVSSGFRFQCVAPSPHSLWVRNKKVAISAARNSGLMHARGELVVNLDDCCALPPNYLEAFAHAWKNYKVCLAATWPENHDWRLPGLVTEPGRVYGFGSYPLKVALQLNGYDEAFDGAQGLEDADWSTRLFEAGVKMALMKFDGFYIHEQGGHSAAAIDLERPIVKCCNLAWYTQRIKRQVQVANTPGLWAGRDGKALLRTLVGGPCEFLTPMEQCGYHGDGRPCAYLDRGFPKELDPLAAKQLEEPPVVDLRAERKKRGL